MNLTVLDHKFINLMVRFPEHREVLKQKLMSKPIVLANQRGLLGRYVAFVKNMVRYAGLIIEVLISSTHFRNQQQRFQFIFYESNSYVLAHRIAYLEYHLPSKQFMGVSYSSRILVHSNLREIILVIVRLGILLTQQFFRPSELGIHYVRIARICLLVHSYAELSLQSAVYLFRIYQVEATFVAAYLRERGVSVNLIPSTTPLTPHNKYLIGDSLKICNPYQRDEFMFYRNSCVCKHWEMWSPEEIHLLAPYYSSKKISDHFDVIGLYTQGFWLRSHLGLLDRQTVDILKLQENELIQILLDYLRGRPAVKLIIFPHPLERRFFLQAGEHQFNAVMSHPQVTVDFSERSSIFSFDQVGLGITTTSTIGFDRIYMGFRTLFYTPYSSFPDQRISSPYNALFIKSREQLLAQIDLIRNMKHTEFMMRYFNGFFWSPSALLVDKRIIVTKGQ